MSGHSTLCATLLGALACAGAASCARPTERSATLELPSVEGFATVSGTLQAHCGTLDCHGSPARNLRIYSVYGMRAAADCVPGNPDTTELDLSATYRAVLGVDPEGLRAAMSSDDPDPRGWLLLAKGRGHLQHKGGAQLALQSPGHRCILSWVRGNTDESACLADVLGPTPRQGEVW